MSQSQGLKDRELQAYYESLFVMYSTPGWQMLMEDVEFMRKRHDTARDLDSERALFFRRGELDQMDWLATHQQRTEAAYAMALEEQDGEDAGDDVQTGGVARVIEPGSPEAFA